MRKFEAADWIWLACMAVALVLIVVLGHYGHG